MQHAVVSLSALSGCQAALRISCLLPLPSDPAAVDVAEVSVSNMHQRDPSASMAWLYNRLLGLSIPEVSRLNGSRPNPPPLKARLQRLGSHARIWH